MVVGGKRGKNRAKEKKSKAIESLWSTTNHASTALITRQFCSLRDPWALSVNHARTSETQKTASNCILWILTKKYISFPPNSDFLPKILPTEPRRGSKPSPSEDERGQEIERRLVPIRHGSFTFYFPRFVFFLYYFFS